MSNSDGSVVSSSASAFSPIADADRDRLVKRSDTSVTSSKLSASYPLEFKQAKSTDILTFDSSIEVSDFLEFISKPDKSLINFVGEKTNTYVEFDEIRGSEEAKDDVEITLSIEFIPGKNGNEDKVLINGDIVFIEEGDKKKPYIQFESSGDDTDKDISGVIFEMEFGDRLEIHARAKIKPLPSADGGGDSEGKGI